ncbi:PilZ domain-containing protein [bacterium]|jgi:hypothetical protein|nr:PilZ domain-containing protein [bacterium]
MFKKRSSFDKALFLENQYVELIVFDPDKGKIGLISRIKEITDDKLVIHWPRLEGETKFPFTGIRFAVFQALVGFEVISFKVTLNPETLNGFDVGVMQLDPPRFMEGIEQKRVYQRIQKRFPVQFRMMDEGRFSDNLYEANSTNISIGGMEFASVDRLEPGMEIECFFKMEYVDFNGIRAEVVRRTDSPQHKDIEFLYAIKFQAMFERERVSLNQLLLKGPGKGQDG